MQGRKSRRRSASGGTDIGKKADSRFFELARVLVRFDRVARFIKPGPGADTNET
jgi:hypothetical protein